MNKTSNLYKDIIIGFFFIIGMFSFLSGEFIISTVLFGTSALLSNLNVNPSLRA